MATIKRVGVLTGGGDCPGLNAVIRAVTKSLIHRHQVQVVGIEDGFVGLVKDRMRPLDWDSVSGILQTGGTILGTSNSADPFCYVSENKAPAQPRDASDQVMQVVQDRELDAIVCIGGDGTMTIANRLSQKGLNIVGVPKTIDNDVFGTDITFGYDTAVSIAADALDRIHTTAQSHHRVMVVEIMGRYAGWLTLGAGLASGADVILIPEIEYDLDAVCDVVYKRSKHGRRFSIIAIAEGAKPIGGEFTVRRHIEHSPDTIRLGGVSMKLSDDIEEQTGLETRPTILGYLQRGGPPTAFDRILATRYGVAATECVMANTFNRMVALQGNSITNIPLSEVGGKIRKVDTDSQMVAAALQTGASVGISTGSLKK